MNNFGACRPLKVLQDEFGFRMENVVAAAKKQLQWAA
jgi:transketolase